ncbi:MAG: DNRLRE domain-containing protein, partial [Candidatus Brocadiia bacterium]|nr:DNRLRE domain-containing protein [Candidatus Brocadiia bacterium]
MRDSLPPAGLSVMLAVLLSIPAAATAEAITVVVQRGGDTTTVDDVADVHLYAGIPGHNYGGFHYLAAGTNVVNESYIALLRFGLEALPPPATVLQATMYLRTCWPQTPSSPCLVDAHPISSGNAGWVEGEARGYAVAGAACWNARARGEAQWIGGAGLANADADYSLPPIATATISPEQTGWIAFELAREAVQRWVSDPNTNTGMRLSVRGAQKVGNLLGVHSSESAEAPELRPKLVLK